eukprot:1545791-Pyramimonas_sp.AAC.1
MVRSDASKFGFKGKVLKQLVKSHASRGIRQRLKELTGIDRDELTHFRVRCAEGAGDGQVDNNGSPTMDHPFILLSTHIQQLYAADDAFFEIEEQPANSQVVSNLINSPEYQNHGLVNHLRGSGETVVPVGFYADGVA